jgi:hypothetical protein
VAGVERGAAGGPIGNGSCRLVSVDVETDERRSSFLRERMTSQSIPLGCLKLACLAVDIPSGEFDVFV